MVPGLQESLIWLPGGRAATPRLRRCQGSRTELNHEGVVRDAADLAAAVIRESGDIAARLAGEFALDDRGDARGGRPRSRVPPYSTACRASPSMQAT
jgi:hypothetical protein